jgi:hypothetical protein
VQASKARTTGAGMAVANANPFDKLSEMDMDSSPVRQEKPTEAATAEKARYDQETETRQRSQARRLEALKLAFDPKNPEASEDERDALLWACKGKDGHSTRFDPAHREMLFTLGFRREPTLEEQMEAMV